MPDSPSTKSSPPRKLEDIIAEKQGILSPTDTVAVAADRMRSLNADMLPVSDGRRLVGMVDERDPDRKAAGHGHDPNVVQIGESMNHHAVFCYEDQTAAEARKIMTDAGVNCLPIVDRSLRIVGMINRADVANVNETEGEA